MEPISKNEIINAFNIVLPYLAVLFDHEASIALADTEVFLNSVESEALNLGSTVGKPIAKKGAAYNAIMTGEIQIKELPKDIYGIPFKSYAVPIKNNKNVVEGCILLGKSLVKRNELIDFSQLLAHELDNINGAINEIAQEVQKVVIMNDAITMDVQDAIANMKNTDLIVDFIGKIASRTNLLGLNASIEAVRTGAQGNGFNVVAQEIRNLSTVTNESVKKVSTVLEGVDESIKKVMSKTLDSNKVFQEQSAYLQEIVSSIEEINCKSHQLIKMADSL